MTENADSHKYAFKLLAERIEAASWKLKTNWKPFDAAEKAEYEEAFLEEAAQMKPHLDKAAIHWISNGDFPELSSRETLFLLLRFIGAWRFLYQMEIEDGSTVFRTTASSETELLTWLLTEWGHEVGTMEGLDYMANGWETQDKFKKRYRLD